MRKKIPILRLISLFSGVYLWLFTGISAYANPQGPQVVHGQAGFSNPNPHTLHVANSPNAIINWQGFSIQSHEVTRFIQQSSNSAVLNRVTGPDPSHLLGQLLSNGKVFLINPHGMVFGPGCVIDTAGFVASTLNITDQDFLQGNLKFNGGPDSGSIVNQGFITAGKNGDIYLIAPDIENSGILHTEGGNLLLAAGESITITSLDLKDVHFEIQAPENEVLNIGKVLADGGAVNMFAGTLKHSGEIRADTVSVDETGTVILSAGKDIILESGSIVSASGTPGVVHNGGEVRIIAEDTLNMKTGAQLHVDGGPDGGDGGFMELSGKQKIALNGIYTGRARVEGFRNGSLLLDPTNIIIINGGGDNTGGDGVILAGDPGATLNIDPTSLFGGWTNVSLAASNDITVSSPIVDGNIPLGGSLALDAGNNVNINADIGSIADYFEHDLFVNAGNTINVNAGIYLQNNDAFPNDLSSLFAAQGVNFAPTGLININDAAAGESFGIVRIHATDPGAIITMNAGSSVTQTGLSSPGALIRFQADDMVLDGTITSLNVGVTLETYNAGREIDLGTNTAGKLGLTNAELNNITANNISVTGLNSGDVTVSSPINLLSTNDLLILVQSLISIQNGTGITVPLSLLLEGTDMDIQADLTANSKITLQTPGAGTPMEVGTSGSGAGFVALDQAELNHINVNWQLQIGQWDVPDITVTNPVSFPKFIYLRSQDNIHVNASVTASEITLRPGGGAGDVVNVAADLTATAGNIDASLGTGVVNFTGSSTITASSFSADTVNSGGGSVRFDAPLNITGDLNVTAGNVELNQGGDYGGNFNVVSPANLEFAGGSHVFSGPSDFSGTGFYVLSGGSFAGAGSVTNNAIFDIMTGTSIAPAFINAGTTSGSGTVNFQGGYTQTGGQTMLMSGTDLAVTGPLTLNGGILMGDGKITGNVLNNGGVVIVDSSPATGTLTIDGNYTQGPGGMLMVELGGLTQGVTYDLLDVSGTATLDGMLDVNLIAPFNPASLDTFEIIRCGVARVGNFATENPPAGKTMIVNYNSMDVTLSNIVPAGPSLNQWVLGADGDWDVAGNWSLGIPLNSQDVEIDLGSWVITVPTSYAADAGTLYVGANNTLSLLAGSTLNVGTLATIDGDLTITGGEFRVTGGDAAINGLLALQGGLGPNQFAELTANNILINGPSLQVTGGAGNNSYASVRSTVGDLTINVTNGITVQGGTATGSDAYLQAQTAQDIDAAFVEVIGDVGDAFIDTNAGMQAIDTTGQNPGHFGILVEATGAGLAAIHSDGTQAINVSNAYYMKVVGTVGNADISSNGSQTITVNDADSVKVVGTVGAAWISSANGSQTVTLQGGGQNRLEVGAVGALNYSHIRSDGGDQTIHAGTGGDTQGKIVLQGGDHLSAEAQIFTTTDTVGQNITAKEAIDLHGKTAGAGAAHLAGAYIGSKGGFQTITVGGGTTVTGISIDGGEASGTDEFNHAYSDIFLDGGAQTITVNDGGNITLTGGTAGSFNSAQIHINTLGSPGSQTIEINGGDLIITGGSGGNGNWAGIWAGMPGLQHITADNITVTGGTSNNSEAYIVYNTLGAGQQLDVNGTLAINGGSGALTQKAEGFVFAEVNQTIFADSITVSGGASGVFNRASINAGDSQDITVGPGGLLVQAGNSTVDQPGSGNYAGIFLNPGATGSQAIVANGGGDINVLAGNGFADDWAAINSEGTGNTVTLNGGGDLVIAGGSSNASDFHADAELYSSNDLTVNVSGDIDISGGTGIDSGAYLFSIGDLQVTVNGSVNLTGGAGNVAEAFIESDNDVLVKVTSGNVNMQGGSGNNAWAGISADGSLVMDVTAGNLSVTGGGGSDASAGVTIDGGGTIDVSVGGNLTLTGGSGPDASAAIGSEGVGTPTINIDVAGDLVMSGGAGQGPAAIGTRDQSVTINIGKTNPVGGNITVSGGTGANALALIGAIGAGHDADVKIKTNGSLTLNAQTGGSLIGSELATGLVDIETGMDGTGGMTLNDGLIRTYDNIWLTATGGNITQNATGIIYNGAGTANRLNVNANGGINLLGVNTVGQFSATDTSGLGITFNNNTSLGLGIVDAGAGNFTLNVTAGNSITDANSGSMNIIANLADLNALGGSVGTLADPIETQVNTLVVTDADVEVGINNNGPLSISNATFPAAVTANILLMASTIDFSGALSTPGSLDLRGSNGITVNWDLNSTGGDLKLAAGSGALLIDGVTVTANQNMTLSGSSVRIEGNGANNALATAGGDQAVNAGGLLVKGSDTGIGDAKLDAAGIQTINASSVTVQGGNNANATASIDPASLVMNVSGDVNVLGGNGAGSYAEISADTVHITAGPTAGAGHINVTGGSCDGAGAWIKSFSGDVTLIAGDTMFPADINLVGGDGINSDSYIDAGGGTFDVYLTFNNGVGLTLLPALTGATDVGILAMCMILNSYDPFYQPPVDPINDVVSSQDQLDELLDEIMGLPYDLIVTGDSTGDDEEEEEKKRGRLICR
jgi:filamentous hemagglutinin family protein